MRTERDVILLEPTLRLSLLRGRLLRFLAAPPLERNVRHSDRDDVLKRVIEVATSGVVDDDVPFAPHEAGGIA